MTIKDVMDAMEDLLEAHGCDGSDVIHTADPHIGAVPIDGFDFGEDGFLYVIKSGGEYAE